ncbi:hypothetical protein SARC_13201 [Sphaeroforma arctica JP610]|uniref:Uncharacterized protein n=1 Tax=Sphaeroforma arctica JP610 TaxID=667725 RepID=A0A0L0FCQ8_9EUKA|nr:hypothetical protein SARC_13201 [Sphaeroforma arctica JP610]KNC74246.1 hypothetical protein SARC_13201 [Sphaeroforma arctica JP610]|eukprot:XP_014148148.1 hypothetical protein SARC_13201 [Sphaeroforma arctica JP610]
MAAMMQMSVLWATIFILCAQLNFYIATWDEYHTHEMYLPKINGADEGLVLTVLLYMLTAFVLPRGVWLMEVYTVPLNVWFTIVSLLSALFTANMFVGRVRDHSREKGWPLERAWWKLLPFGITVSQTVYWLLVVTAATNAFDYAVFEVLLCCAFCFGQFTSRLIVAHVCGMHFKAWQPALWVPMIPITAHILTAVLDVTVVPPSTVLHITLCISGLMWLHYAYVCINAISSSLGIRRFNIETRHVPEVSGVLPER